MLKARLKFFSNNNAKSLTKMGERNKRNAVTDVHLSDHLGVVVVEVRLLSQEGVVVELTPRLVPLPGRPPESAPLQAQQQS